MCTGTCECGHSMDAHAGGDTSSPPPCTYCECREYKGSAEAHQKRMEELYRKVKEHGG